MKSEAELHAELVNKTAELPAFQAKLHILNGANTGQDVALNKTLTTLGKPGVQVVVITKRNNGYFLSQLEGESAKVNDQPVQVLSYSLTNKDVLEVSGIKMEFSVS